MTVAMRKGRPRLPGRDAEMDHLWAGGMSLKAIGQQYEVTVTTVWRAIRRAYKRRRERENA